VDRVLAPVTWLAAAFAVLVLLIGPEVVGAKKSGPAAVEGSGVQLFYSAGCGTCHTLKAAGTRGTTGPNLDQLKPDAATVRRVVTNGKGGMPSFGGDLSAKEIKTIADFVAAGAGR
jgi:mono/diheme cytochrome c family protein